MKHVVLATVFLLGSVTPHATATASPDEEGCTPKGTARTIRAFVAAYNAGDVDEIDRLWAPEPEFQWYFVNDEREDDAEERSTLRSYFEERMRLNDDIRRLRLHVHSDGVNFSFKLMRRTDDDRRRAAGLFHGKGAMRETSVWFPSLQEPLPATKCLLAVWAMDRHVE